MIKSFFKRKENMVNTSIGKISKSTIKNQPDIIKREFQRFIEKKRMQTLN